MTRHFCHDVGRHVSDQCFGTPASTTTLLLLGQARSDRCFGTLASATTLLLCGQARSDQCFGTPASATTLLLRGQGRSDQCFGTLALCYGTSVLYYTFGYLLCCVLLISYYWSRQSNSYMIRL